MLTVQAAKAICADIITCAGPRMEFSAYVIGCGMPAAEECREAPDAVVCGYSLADYRAHAFRLACELDLIEGDYARPVAVSTEDGVLYAKTAMGDAIITPTE